jgi:hypothetical protein
MSAPLSSPFASTSGIANTVLGEKQQALAELVIRQEQHEEGHRH